MLLAIEIKGGDEGNDSKISINPRGAKIQANTQGFFIAQSADEVKRYGVVNLITKYQQLIRFNTNRLYYTRTNTNIIHIHGRGGAIYSMYCATIHHIIISCKNFLS